MIILTRLYFPFSTLVVSSLADYINICWNNLEQNRHQIKTIENNAGVMGKISSAQHQSHAYV